MSQPPTRRTFLRGASLGAAAAGAVVVSPGLLTGTAQAATPDGPAVDVDGLPHDGAVTAYVRDHTTGEIVVMSGETEIVVHDRALARRLATLAGRARRF